MTSQVAILFLKSAMFTFAELLILCVAVDEVGWFKESSVVGRRSCLVLSVLVSGRKKRFVSRGSETFVLRFAWPARVLALGHGGNQQESMNLWHNTSDRKGAPSHQSTASRFLCHRISKSIEAIQSHSIDGFL